MSKRYIITIKEESEETVTRGNNWELGAGDTSTDFGYTPEIKVTKLVERIIYSQNVDRLDVKAVIAAVNQGETT